MNVRALLPLLGFLVLVGFLGFGLYNDPKKIPSPLIGKAAAAFDLPDIKNPDKRITNKDFLGKVSLFNFWATWCPTCRQEHPLLVDFAKRTNVPIYGVNHKDDRKEALRWLQAYGDPYLANAFDPQGTIGIDYGVIALPETFLIDKKGIIRFKKAGPISSKDIEETLLPLIKKLEQE